MSRFFLFLAVFLLLLSATLRPCSAQRFRVMAYNVENLFDTCHDATSDDRDFLPTAERRWNSPRYWGKQGRLARVIAMAGGEAPAALVALCEVENDTVVRDLTGRTKLHRLGYRYFVTQSLDRRGLDVALLYQPLRFKPLTTENIRLPFSEDYGRHTRDILHVSGLLQTGDTLDVFVCHMPSRRGESIAAEKMRFLAAQTLRQKADSVQAHRQKPAILMLGDFNDEATDRSIRGGLGAHTLPAEYIAPEAYYVLSDNLQAADGIRGTYKFRGRWNQLDQIIVSGTLLDGSASLRISAEDCRLFAPAPLTLPDKTHGGRRVNATYRGTYYAGGFSDHLPLVADFELEE